MKLALIFSIASWPKNLELKHLTIFNSGEAETDALAGPRAETEEIEASTDEMRLCPFGDPSLGQSESLAETGTTPLVCFEK
jgi:hypothetical protein